MSEKSLEAVIETDKGSGDQEKKIAETERDPGRNVFQRYINLPAIVNFAFTLQVSWEGCALTFQLSLPNGGPASIVYGSLFATIGVTAIVLSIAELASMDPVVGAQYRWSAAFAPSNPEFWGLFQGWITVLGWVTTSAAVPILLANVVTGLAVFNNESYVVKPWHTTLLMWAFIVLCVVPNFWCRKLFNTFEVIGAICHFVMFIASIIIFATLGKWGPSSFVFDTLIHDVSGWANPAVCWGIGLMTLAFPLSGFDGTIHMSDEVKQPNTRVPYSMISSITVNGLQMFVFMTIVMYVIGDYQAVMNSRTGLPILEVYHEAVKNKHATNFLVFMVMFIMFLCLFNIFTSVSRLVWSFATDKGLPFSEPFAKIHPTLGIPLNALLLVGVICALLALIPIGSAVAFFALVSIPMIALYISYFIPILFIMIRKLQGRHPKYGPFKLGRWGIPLNLFSLIYILFILSFVALPPYRPVTAANMNYAGPLVLFVMAMALVDWFINGHRRFKVPVPRALQGDI